MSIATDGRTAFGISQNLDIFRFNHHSAAAPTGAVKRARSPRKLPAFYLERREFSPLVTDALGVQGRGDCRSGAEKPKVRMSLNTSVGHRGPSLRELM